jgi:cold shock protein
MLIINYNTMSLQQNNDTTSVSQERLTGRVKWFNNKTGYGFITVTLGSNSGTDVFVHHSSVEVENQQYKYLVQGEYVEFTLSKTTSGPHAYQATTVSGLNGGKLMCETRREFRIARTTYRTAKVEPAPVPVEDVTKSEEAELKPRQKKIPKVSSNNIKESKTPRVRGEGPRDASDTTDWTLIKKNKNVEKSKTKFTKNVTAELK